MVKLARVHFENRRLEPTWHVQSALLVAIGLQFLLDERLAIGHRYLIGGFELLLVVLLAFIRPRERRIVTRVRRDAAITLIAIITLANFSSLGLVVNDLFNTGTVTGKDLILSALAIYLTNIIIFGIWYWEMDNDNVQGESNDTLPTDFLFPQVTIADSKITKDWSPTFFDYLYISITNGTAFGTNDSAPLTHRAKVLMSIQSLISITIVALVIARAVSILA